MKVEDTLPVINDEEFRQKQMERFIGGVESVGNYFEEIKKQQKWSLIMTIVYFGLFFIVLGSVFGYAYFKGGFFGLTDMNAPIRKIDCSNGYFNDTLRTYSDAKDFITVFGGYCNLRLSKD